MNYPTHALDLHPVANRWLVHLRKANDSRTPRDPTHFGPGPTTHEPSDLRSSAHPFRSGLDARVEYALFAVTLAAVGYLYWEWL